MQDKSYFLTAKIWIDPFSSEQKSQRSNSISISVLFAACQSNPTGDNTQDLQISVSRRKKPLILAYNDLVTPTV